MTAKQLIDEAAQKGIKLWWEPFEYGKKETYGQRKH